MFDDFHKMKSREVFPGFTGRFIHSETMTLAYWEIKKDSVSPEHNHVHEQVAYVVEGQLELTIEGKSRILTPGMIAVVPSNARHSGKAITDCTVLDVFNPVREDYK